MGASGQLYYDAALVSTPGECAPTQTYRSHVDLSGDIQIPVEHVPNYLNIFEGGDLPVTALMEHNATEVSTTPSSSHIIYEGQQSFTPSSEIVSTWGLVQYSQASASKPNEAVLCKSPQINSQFIPFLANQAHGEYFFLDYNLRILPNGRHVSS